VLDTQLTQELIDEGTVREFVSNIQNLRKSSGYEVTDRINITVDGDQALTETLLSATNTILKDCLALSFTKGATGEFCQEFDYNGQKVVFYISR